MVRKYYLYISSGEFIFRLREKKYNVPNEIFYIIFFSFFISFFLSISAYHNDPSVQWMHRGETPGGGVPRGTLRPPEIACT